MKTTQLKTSSTVGAIAALSLLSFSCNREKQSFTSSDLISGNLPSNVGYGRPLYIRMDNGCLMAFIYNRSVTLNGFPDDERLDIYKTSIGYAESGKGADFAGISSSVDITSLGIFHRISYSEALAYFDFSWEKLNEKIRASYKELGSESTNPDFIKYHLEPLALGIPERIQLILDNPKKYEDPFSAPTPEDRRYAQILASTLERRAKELKSGTHHLAEPLFLKIPGTSNLLQISQVTNIDADIPAMYMISHMSPAVKRITFLRNAEGYGVEGQKLSVAGYGTSSEHATGSKFMEISAAEAIILMGGKESILSAAKERRKITHNSVNPELLKEYLIR